MTATPEIAKIVCPGCFAVLDAGDRFCRHCGTAITPGGEPRGRCTATAPLPCHYQTSAARAPDGPRWTENPWFVVPMLFLVLGPIGIPMLWRSRCIAPVWKMVLTLAVLALTAFAGVMIWHTIRVSLAPLEQLRRIQGL